MSHFAELNENNVVIRVLVGDNNMPNEGYDWFVENLGGRWIQTSYNGNFRGCFAGVGYIYDETLDVFKKPIRNPRKLNPNMIPPTSQENTTVYTFGDDENVT